MVGLIHETPAEQINGRLKRIVHGRTEADVVTLQFIGLEAARTTSGSLWPQRWTRLRRTAEAMIRERLAPEDILVRATDGFVIAYSKQNGQAARQAAADLAEELNRRFRAEASLAPQVAVSIQTISVGDLARSIAQGTPGRLEPPRETARMPEVSEIDWQFHPVWDVKHETVSSYFMSPHVRGTGARVRGYQFEAMPPTNQDYLLLDAESIAASERALKRLRLQRKKALIGISLHVSSLTTERGAAMLLSKLDSCNPMLASWRLIKLAGVDSGFPRIHLASIVGSLRARVPKVVVSAAWHETDPSGLIQAGATAFGFAYPDHVASELSTHASGTLMARFRAGVDIAHAEGVPLYVEGAIGPHLAKEFRAAGADYICSPVIWAPKSEPDAMARWPSSLLPN